MATEELECCEDCQIHPDRLDIVNSGMPEEEELYDLEAEVCVCDLAETLHMTQSAISHQLRILKQSKLVKSRREGKSVFYSLADGHVRTIIAQGREHIEEK